MTGSAATLSIDLAALVQNWQLLASRCATAECGAVVKADAYGIGMAEAAPVLRDAGCGTFFVATVDEGAALRGLLGPDSSIVVLHGPGDVEELRRRALLPVLNSLEQLAAWTAAAKRAGGALPCVLHLDTGINRLGLGASDVATLGRDPGLLAGADVRLVMSHLACAEDAANKMNRRQLVTFLQRTAALPAAPKSLANSAGVFLGDAYHFDIVRPGIALYGANPVPGTVTPFGGVVWLRAPIVQVRRVDRGETVGYGATFPVQGPSRIATVAVGYADGYLRSLSGRGNAFLPDARTGIGGTRVPVVGRVSMDLITLDVSAAPEADAHPGALVELIGSAIKLDEVAAAAGTIPYEILTSLGSRYRREYRYPMNVSPEEAEAIGARN